MHAPNPLHIPATSYSRFHQVLDVLVCHWYLISPYMWYVFPVWWVYHSEQNAHKLTNRCVFKYSSYKLSPQHLHCRKIYDYKFIGHIITTVFQSRAREHWRKADENLVLQNGDLFLKRMSIPAFKKSINMLVGFLDATDTTFCKNLSAKSPFWILKKLFSGFRSARRAIRPTRSVRSDHGGMFSPTQLKWKAYSP